MYKAMAEFFGEASVLASEFLDFSLVSFQFLASEFLRVIF